MSIVSDTKLWWRYSSLRFFILNASWNYRFWLNAKKQYEEKEYRPINENGFYTGEKKKIRKFVGYLYNGETYLDNPGLPIKDRDVWEKWKKKGLIR